MALAMISLVVAGGISLMRTNDTIELSSGNETILKRTNNLQEIKVEVSEIECDNKYCYAKVFQEGLINTEFRCPKSYCSTEEIQLIEEINETVCIAWMDYTSQELINLRNEFVTKRLSDYAVVQEQRELKQNSKTPKVGAGTLISKK